MAAAAHPINALPMGTLIVAFLMTGLFAAVAMLVAIDVVALFTGLQLGPIRRGVMKRASRAARQRAAQKLSATTRCEWQGLETMCHKIEPFNLRRGETEELLNGFLNTALALQYATACSDTVGGERRELKGQEAAVLAAERQETAARTEQALAVLRRQLERTAQRIRLHCEAAVADECEAGAELWGGDLEALPSAIPALGPARARTE